MINGNFYLKRTRLIILEVVKTIIRHHLTNLFPENVAFYIAAFLVESDEERTAKAKSSGGMNH